MCNCNLFNKKFRYTNNEHEKNKIINTYLNQFFFTWLPIKAK